MSICVKLSLCFLAENQLYFNKLKKKKHLWGGEALSSSWSWHLFLWMGCENVPYP